ncbi:MAG: 30S ribosomal protein S17 [Gammaproteobacteria bacterium]
MANSEHVTTTSAKGRSLIGLVTSDKRDKTITVEVMRQVKHPVGKYIRRRTKVHAHDEMNEAGKGDRVRVQECRPFSKSKSWRLMEVIDKAK